MNFAKGRQTYEEICSQFSAWLATVENMKSQADIVKDFFNSRKFSKIVLTGCGTSFYLAQTGAFILADILKGKTLAAPASEIFLFPKIYIDQDTALIAFSRSGTTTEVLKAVEVCHKYGAKVLAISCRDQSPLINLADASLVAINAEDKSVVQTRSFTTMYVMVLGLAALVADRLDYIEELSVLPGIAEQKLVMAKPLIEDLARNEGLQTFVFLGSGHNYGLACGAMLNLKETSLSHTEAYHFLEFRHGPLSIVNCSTLVIGFLSDLASDLEIAVIKEAIAAGARALVLSKLPVIEAHFCITIPGLTEYTRSIAFFPILHLFALYRAIAKGLDPDAPPHLRRIVTI